MFKEVTQNLHVICSVPCVLNLFNSENYVHSMTGGIAVTPFGISAELLYLGPSKYWDG